MSTAPAPTPAPAPRLFSFIAGNTGPWRVESMATIVGEPMAQAARIEVVTGACAFPNDASWLLRGITSNERYVERTEKDALVGKQEGLGRAHATCAALIPIRKTATWWALTQDERRQIFEAQSRHIQIGLQYLPAVARRLHHCRDLGPYEPFDFVTWFEYAPGDQAAFEALLQALHASPEWAYVDREIDIRMCLAAR